MKALTIALLFIGGLAHLVPDFYNFLSDFTNGTPWIQIGVGLLSVIVAVLMIFKKEQN